MKVLFVTKKRLSNYGISVGLLNSATFVANALEYFDVETKVVSVIDGNCIDREVHLYRPDHVVLEALWVTASKLEELAKKYKHIQWCVRIHSKTPFLANEGIALEWIGQYKKLMKTYHNIHLASNNKEFNQDISKVTKVKFDYLPNIYQPNYKSPHKHKKSTCEFIDIGCFGAIRPLKNHLEQAVAAILFAEELGKKVRFHINAGRTEQRGEEVLKNLRGLFKTSEGHELVEHGWMSHSDFVKLIATMDISMQVSMSESFNIVTADAIYSNVPVVVSEDIDWLPQVYRACPTDTQDIIDKLKVVWKSCLATTINKICLAWYNLKSLYWWLKYIYGTRFATAKQAVGFYKGN